MTLADAAPAAPQSAGPARRRGRGLIIAVAVALLLGAVGVTTLSWYYDSVPLTEHSVAYPVVSVEQLPEPVPQAFVAAVDPDFYEARDSLITRRYAAITAGDDDTSSWPNRIRARKAEAAYTKTEILDRYLNRADFGRGAVGLVAAAQTYFHKPAEQLTVSEAAALATRLDPDRPAPEAGWRQVLDTMVERGWLTPADRDGLTFPG